VPPPRGDAKVYFAALTIAECNGQAVYRASSSPKCRFFRGSDDVGGANPAARLMLDEHRVSRKEKHMSIKAIVLTAMIATSFAAAAQSGGSKNNPSDPAKQDPLTMQGSAPEDWDMTKGHDKGYLTKEDAQPNSWLAQNFKSCDADHDGKVTQAEYTKCQKQKSR
jgi:hypothetical protein